jgi:hypothetical protein
MELETPKLFIYLFIILVELGFELRSSFLQNKLSTASATSSAQETPG